MEFEQEEEQSRSVSCGTSKAQMHEEDSNFGDQNCGEPLLAQRLRIDFTPDEELYLDSDYNQKKCRAFWDFIKSKPELQHLMAVPDVVDYGESCTGSDDLQSADSWPEALDSIMERTAVSALELAQEEGQMKPAFLGMQQSHCSVGSREYPEAGINNNNANKKPYVCACKGSCDRCRRGRSKTRSRLLAPNAVAVDLCKKIDKWDAEHPKSKRNAYLVFVELHSILNKIKLIFKRRTDDASVTKDKSGPENNFKALQINLSDDGVSDSLEEASAGEAVEVAASCRPICKSRRREWNGVLQDTSAERLLDRKPVPECFRRCPTKVFPNSECPLFGRTRRVTQVRRDRHHTPEVVRICQAPIDDTVDTTYLKLATLAKTIGAWDAVQVGCPFCACGGCCPCARAQYEPRDADRAASARRDMRLYDSRVGRTYQEMRTMYDM